MDKQRSISSSQDIRKARRRQSTQVQSNKSHRKIEITSYPSGLKLILSDQTITEVSKFQGANAVEAIKEYMTRYLKQEGNDFYLFFLLFQDLFTRLRPIDLQILCEYCRLITQFTSQITSSAKRRELMTNILLDIFMYDNPKLTKFHSINKKNYQKDVQRLHYLLNAHKTDINSNEMLKLVRWVQIDYLSHYELLNFQMGQDQGALDIVYNLLIDEADPIPALSQANFIPQQANLDTQYDSQEEDNYAFKRGYITKKKLQKEVLNNDEIQNTNEVADNEQKNEIETYIEAQINQVCFALINQYIKKKEELQNKLQEKTQQLNESLVDDKNKKGKK